MKSYLHQRKPVGGSIPPPSARGGVGPRTRRRQRRTLGVYAGFCVAALVLRLTTRDPALHGFAVGLVFPGAGFLQWAGIGGTGPLWAVSIAGVSAALFGMAALLWSATGNVVLMPIVWVGTALLAGRPETMGLDPGGRAGWEPIGVALPLLLPVLAALGLEWPRRKGRAPAPAPLPAAAAPTAPREEIGLEDLRRLRLLLDRALQPVAEFNGFEWRDQYQTAAIRYQLTFISHALSMAHHHYLPASTCCARKAQERLLAKQGDPRVWGYWARENAWGNLRLGRDPVPRENIMYTGFVATQMAYANGSGALRLFRNGKEWRRYGLGDMVGLLTRQYRTAPFGLLACEPNWIYPLCNMITATAIRAHDARAGGGHWHGIAARFRAALTEEFTTPDGRFVAFRSALTGFAPPPVGGAVMRAFPCLFLNVLFPDLAARQWHMLRDELAVRDWRRAFWPIDVGNYGFSRASNLAASAAAAVEMGDGAIAARVFAMLEEECPPLTRHGVTHRANASLWAHALELTARLGRTGGLAALVERPAEPAAAGVFLETAPYPEVLIARAKRSGDGALELVLHPDGQGGPVSLGLAGMVPGRRYRAGGAGPEGFTADAAGRATLALPLTGRTECRVAPVA